jgi:type 1 glutamine amidotransferase
MIKKVSRRNFVRTGLLAGAGSLTLPTILAAQKNRAKKLLFVSGGWEGHEPKKCLDLFLPWMEETGFDVRISDTLDAYLDMEYMKTVDIIVQIWTMGEISDKQEKALLNTVKSGVGMAGWHGGLCDAFRQNTKYQFMTGGQWVAHPGGVIDYTVNVADKNDPVTKDISDFKMNSEQYFMHIDPNNKVLATTTFSGEHADWIEGCTMPVVWKKMFGKGRIFYSSLGHQQKDFINSPEAFEIMKRGILWASESKYKNTENLVRTKY